MSTKQKVEGRLESTASFGYWLRRRRKALDLTQAALAQQVGCAVATIRGIEADVRRPSRPMAERLAECLAIAPTERAAFVAAARAKLAVDRLALATQPIDHRYSLTIASEAPAPTVGWHRSRPLSLPVVRCCRSRRSPRPCR